ncbi:MAG: S24 family peptidase [Desulfosudaceae bacterium]
MTINSFNAFYEKITSHLGIRSQSDLADRLGLHRSAVTQAKRHGSVPDSWILNLAEQYHLDPFWLKQATGRPEAVLPVPRNITGVPRVKARLHAGGGSFETSPEVDSGHAFDRDWLRRRGKPDKMVLMDVIGDSMSPVIEEGDTVLIDQSQTEIYAGRIYAVGIDDTVVVKRVEKHPRRLVLHSANQAYAPLFLDPVEARTTRIIGRVIWICRELP